MSKITTIIFDLGGVILNLDQEKTLKGFATLGVDLEKINNQMTLFNDFEKGLISETDFRSGIRSALQQEVNDAQIDSAWNAMLLNLPEERLKIIRNLKKEFNVFLLSNTNSIHIAAFTNYFTANFTGQNWSSFFDKIYYSHEVGLRKPDAEIYEFVLKDIKANARECIFIDDNKLNLVGAESLGIRTIWAKEPLSDITVAEIRLISNNIRHTVS